MLVCSLSGHTGPTVPTVPLGRAAPVGGVTMLRVPVGVTEFEGAEGLLVPTWLVAVAVKFTDTPLAKPRTTIGLTEPCCDCPVEAVTV